MNDPSHNSIRRIGRLIVLAALLAVVVQIGICFVHFAMVAPPSFDGAMNLNVAISFLQGKGYGFFYDSFFPFPAQTDGPFILPAAFALWLGGITPFTTQLVNLLYLVALAAAVYVLLRNMQLPRWIALIGVIVCLRTPGMSDYAINGFGEIPCLALFVLGLIALSSGLREVVPDDLKLTLGGIALGLSIITKTVAFFMVCPTFIIVILFLLVRERKLSRVVYVCSGIATPIVGWELFRLIRLGNSQNYLTWWRLQFGQVLYESGLHENVKGFIVFAATVHSHLEILSQIGLPIVLFFALTAIVFTTMAILGLRLWRSRSFGNLLPFLALSTSAGSYFIWWIFIMPMGMAWLRHLIDGLILLQILLVVTVVALSQGLFASIGQRSTLMRTIGIMAICLVIVAQTMMLRRGGIFTNDPQPATKDIEQIAVAEILRGLPGDAKLFGSGWWQAPVLALFSGREMMNFQRWSAAEINPLPHKYLVMDWYAKVLAMPEFQKILDASTYHVLYDTPHAAIYELLSVGPYVPFKPSDRTAPDLASGFDAINDNYQYLRGLYPSEGKRRWSSPDAGFLLRRTNQDRLLLTLSMPDQLQKSNLPADLLLSIFSQGCIDTQLRLEVGRQTLNIPLTCPPTTESAVLEISVHLNAHIPFVQKIEGDQRRLGFLFESARLVDSQHHTSSGG